MFLLSDVIEGGHWVFLVAVGKPTSRLAPLPADALLGSQLAVARMGHCHPQTCASRS